MVQAIKHITTPCGDQLITYDVYVDLPMRKVINLDNQCADTLNNGTHMGKRWIVQTLRYSDDLPYTAIFRFKNEEDAVWFKLAVMS